MFIIDGLEQLILKVSWLINNNAVLLVQNGQVSLYVGGHVLESEASSFSTASPHLTSS